MKRQLWCGTAKRCITPPISMISALRGLKHYSFAGVLSDLYVRVALLEADGERLLLIGYDLNTAPCSEEILQELTQITGTSESCIFMFATHTHSVPVHSLSLERTEELDDTILQESSMYTEFLWEQTVVAAKAALAAMQPARMGYAFGESGINVVRLQDYTYEDENDETFTVCNLGCDTSRIPDRRLFALKVESIGGAPLLIHVNYPMHCVATIWNDFDGSGAMGISGDVAGEISGLLEKQYPGSIAMWSSGAAGDLNPLLLNEMITPDPDTGRTKEWKAVGKEYAENCLKVMTERQFADIKKLLSTVRCDQTEGPVISVSEWSVTPGVDCIRREGQPPLFCEGEAVPEHRVYLQMARLGELYLIGVGAELYSALGKAMIHQVSEHAVIITHCGSTLGKCHYILDDETIERCDASRGFAMVPGYDEYRCKKGIMKEDLCSHMRSMKEKLTQSEI